MTEMIYEQGNININAALHCFNFFLQACVMLHIDNVRRKCCVLEFNYFSVMR